MKITKFQLARRCMKRHLKDEGLRQTYRANISMKIWDNHRDLNYSKVEDCDKIAEKLIELIFG